MRKTYRDFHFAAYKMNTSYFVRSVGDFRLLKNAKELVKKVEFPEIFWCIEGCGSFFYEGRYHYLRPDQVWYYPAGSVHEISCYGEVFRYRWMAWDGRDAGTVFDGLNLKTGVNFSGPCPHHLFNKLTLNIGRPTLEAQMNNLAAGFEILLNAAQNKFDNVIRIEQMEQVKNIIDENFSNPELNVQSIADLMQMNRSVLSRNFSDTFKVTIVEYIASRRLQEAMYYIKETDIPIHEIASKCGYSCHNYFTKVMRHHTGSTPQELRSM